MAATGTQTAAAVAPGSTPYGEKAGLLAGIQGAMAGGGGPGGGGGQPVPPVPQVGNPIEAMLSGQVKPGGRVPLTDGMSVGAGAGLQDQTDPMLGDRAERVRQIATQATSPQLRLLAIQELRRMARGAV